MESWQEWLQGVSKDVIGKWSDQKFTQDYDLQRLRLQALGEAGFYTEGQPGVTRPGAVLPTTVGGMPTGILIGGAVLLVVVLALRKG